MLAPGWRFGVFLLMVIKKRGVLSLLSCLGVLSVVSCGSLGIGLKVAILKYPEIKAREEILFFLLQQRPLSLLCLASKTTLTSLPRTSLIFPTLDHPLILQQECVCMWSLFLALSDASCGVPVP